MAYVILMLIGVIVGLIHKNKNKKKQSSKEVMVVPIVACFVLCMIVATIADISLPKGLKLQESAPIVALTDTSSSKEKFFLGIGSSTTGMVYTFMEKTDENGFKMKTVPVEDVEIRYGKTPRIETYRATYRDNWMQNAFLINMYIESYVIYVPKGTIKEDYSVDLK